MKNIIGFIKYTSLTVALITIWEWSSWSGWVPPYMLPAPHEVVVTGYETLKDGSLLKNIFASLSRVFIGFIFAVGTGVALGILVAVSDNVRIFTQLPLQILRPIAPIAWIPIMILLFGIGEVSKTAIIFIGAFFPIFANTVSAITQIDPRYFEVSKIFEVPRTKLVWKLIIPAALPQVASGLRISLGCAWLCVVAAEMIAAKSGLGYMLDDGRALAQPDKVILAMIVIGIIGKYMDDILWRMERKVNPYQN
ncbi:ABC transporter permease [Planctomycetales bacterium]|nr:ABC transporter permease [Planctomycetales bacterium]